MINTKRVIIIEEGSNLLIDIPGKDNIIGTKGLIAHATKQFASEISLESHRQAQLFPELGIKNGSIIVDPVRMEEYLVIAHYPEIIRDKPCATICRLIVSNGHMTVETMEETADEYGNIIKKPVEVYGETPIYIQTIKNEVRQQDPGIFYKTIYRIMAPIGDLGDEDRVIIENEHDKRELKIVGVDRSTFPGLMLIDATTETRG